MSTASDHILRLLSLDWLTGPILNKELRISSRRIRNSILRSGYLLGLALFVLLVWMSLTKNSYYQQDPAYTMSRMAEAGQNMVAALVWFQFLGMQAIAVISLSNSISDEIYHRTLGTLMSTPISGLQIVMGKLLSKLLQSFLLLAMSLPVLAIIRVLGGVPWDFVIAGLCLTVCTIVFFASVSIFCSLTTRRAYIAILKAIALLAGLYLLLPFLAVMLLHDQPETAWIPWLLHTHPYATLVVLTEQLISGTIAGRRLFFSWPLTCGVLLGGASAIIAWAALRVRTVALRQAAGESGRSRPSRKPPPLPTGDIAQPDTSPTDTMAGIRRVAGPPVMWRELRGRLVKKPARLVIPVLLGLALLTVTYALVAYNDDLGDDETHAAYAVIFTIIGTLVTAIVAPTCITAEKESQSWAILLATPLSDWQILWGKFAGVVRRVAPAWSLLFLHLVIFALAGLIRPVTILHLLIVATWTTAFLTATGIYFSTLARRTTVAVVMNLAFAAAIWAAIPGIVAVLLDIGRMSDRYIEWYMNGNPIVQAGVLLDNVSGEDLYTPMRSISFHWVDHSRTLYGTTMLLLAWAGAHTLAGLGCLFLAKLRLRRTIV